MVIPALLINTIPIIGSITPKAKDKKTPVLYKYRVCVDIWTIVAIIMGPAQGAHNNERDNPTSKPDKMFLFGCKLSENDSFRSIMSKFNSIEEPKRINMPVDIHLKYSSGIYEDMAVPAMANKVKNVIKPIIIPYEWFLSFPSPEDSIIGSIGSMHGDNISASPSKKARRNIT